MGGRSGSGHRVARGSPPGGEHDARTGRGAPRPPVAAECLSVTLFSPIGCPCANKLVRRCSTRHLKATYPVASGGIAEAHATASIACVLRLVRPADHPVLTIAIRPRTNRSRPWLLCLSAAAGRPASHQHASRPAPLHRPKLMERRPWAADCMENASASSGAAGLASLWRKAPPLSSSGRICGGLSDAAGRWGETGTTCVQEKARQ